MTAESLALIFAVITAVLCSIKDTSIIQSYRTSSVPSKKRMDCQKGLSPIDATTATLSGLYVSAKINPEPPGSGWIARYYGDLVFLCTKQADRIKGPTGVTWVVQQFWHNGLRTCLTDPTRPHINILSLIGCRGTFPQTYRIFSFLKLRSASFINTVGSTANAGTLYIIIDYNV